MKKYVLVLWPEVCKILQYSWFLEECYLFNAFDDQAYHPDSAYFVPEERYKEFKKDQAKSASERGT